MGISYVLVLNSTSYNWCESSLKRCCMKEIEFLNIKMAIQNNQRVYHVNLLLEKVPSPILGVFLLLCVFPIYHL